MSDEQATRIASLDYDYAAQPKQRVEECNLCGGKVYVVLVHRDRYGFPADAVACVRCGLVFLDPRLDSDGYGHFYENVYRPLVSAYHGRRIDADALENEQAAYAEVLVNLLDPYLTSRPQPRILDIGGSTGVVAYAVRQRFGGTATVIDPARAEAARARARGLDAVVGTIEAYDHAGPLFSLVLMCQTIDHLLDVSAVLGKTRALISDSALLFLDIVDFRAAYLRNWNIEDAVKIDHPYYLTEDTADAYIARSGFRVLQKDYATDRLHVGYVCTTGESSAGRLPPEESVRDLLREIRFVQTSRSP